MIRSIKWLALAHPYHPVFTVPGVLIMIALLLSGCAGTMRERPDTLSPVCEALVGPLRYTSKTKESRRYAGPDLATDLAVRNRVGKRLRCPAYR